MEEDGQPQPPAEVAQSGDETDVGVRATEDSLDYDGTSGAAGWSKFSGDSSAPARPMDMVEQFLDSGTAGEGVSALEPLPSSVDVSREQQSSEPDLKARVISTCNQLEEEPWLPVRSIVTMFRISVSCGEKTWELLRRYTEFHELDAQLAKSFDPTVLPALPPKLIVNEDAAIAERFLELDAYLRGLLVVPAIRRNTKLHDFLGVEKHGARYGVRRYEYDSAQSEGNRYIRDNDL
mmetsp:Transcript_43463/g.114224  ORF Transcript_43463/g.114224 Transcript_43463/m.114224 type:complete len:235 (-) Transcript_43463:770-1474(-)